jgi:hypothetical protein
MRLSGTSLPLALALLGAFVLSGAANAQVPYGSPPPAAYPSVSYYAPGYTYMYNNYYPRNAFYFPPNSMPTGFYRYSYASPAYSSGASFYGPSAPTSNIIAYYTPGYLLSVAPMTYYWTPPPPVNCGPYYR